ncbi:uncharacterized protein LOC120692801 isoform X1 [Panicum virgatum]|uniref:uncharacterized protein LOC120692801 isoform X1 n=1 Tax=Panicum virgatum TaxID=38727 RepID=UPI0019D6182C|nr:uncharacterized protein LOC120692801 isoform X1 [Panicum virgatum]
MEDVREEAEEVRQRERLGGGRQRVDQRRASLRLRLLRPRQVATPTRRADHGQYAAVVPHLHPEHSGGGDVPPEFSLQEVERQQQTRGGSQVLSRAANRNFQLFCFVNCDVPHLSDRCSKELLVHWYSVCEIIVSVMLR